MQIFVRNVDGSTLSFTSATPTDLLAQVSARTGLAPSESRLGYGLKSIDPSSTSFEHYGISSLATLDLNMRLRGGAPKKRCAYVYVKTGTTPAQSGTSTPLPVAEQPAASQSSTGEKKQDDVLVNVKPEGEVEAEPKQASEPVMDRCKSAALRMVGECPRCDKQFCGTHRLPEDHACPALANFRKAAFDENRARLEKEATITSKISAF